jgi:hypothetical protein
VRYGSRALVAAGVALALGSGATDAQLVGAELSADTTTFGDRFELRVEVAVPAGAALHVPEVAPETEVASGVDRVRWTVEETPDGAAIVSLVYDMVAYQVGIVPVPEVTFYIEAPADTLSTGRRPDPVALLPEDDPGSPRPGLRPLRVPSRNIWVRSVLGGEDVEGGLAPRPADDVFGASWNAPAVASALAFTSILLLVAFVSGREWLAARAALGGADTISVARGKALRDLDALLAEGWGGTAEDIERVFERSSTIVRRYVEELDRRWNPAFTSTELMRGLSGREHGEEVAGLFRQMDVAEVVKFGPLRPDAEAARAHVGTLRAWVESS